MPDEKAPLGSISWKLARAALATVEFTRIELADASGVARSSVSPWISRKVAEEVLSMVNGASERREKQGRGKSPAVYRVTSKGRENLVTHLRDLGQSELESRVPQSHWYAMAWETLNATNSRIVNDAVPQDLQHVEELLELALAEADHDEATAEYNLYIELLDLRIKAWLDGDPVEHVRRAVAVAKDFSDMGRFLEADHAESSAVCRLTRSELSSHQLTLLLGYTLADETCPVLKSYLKQTLSRSAILYPPLPSRPRLTSPALEDVSVGASKSLARTASLDASTSKVEGWLPIVAAESSV